HKARGADAKNGKIRRRVFADAVGNKSLTIGKSHPYIRSSMNDVAVGEDESVRREHETGSRSAVLIAAPNVDVNHRRTGALRRLNDGLRVGVEEIDSGQCIGFGTHSVSLYIWRDRRSSIP